MAIVLSLCVSRLSLCHGRAVYRICGISWVSSLTLFGCFGTLFISILNQRILLHKKQCRMLLTAVH